MKYDEYTEQVEKIKADGIRVALLDALSKTLWDIRATGEEAGKEFFENFSPCIKKIREACDKADRIYIAAKEYEPRFSKPRKPTP